MLRLYILKHVGNTCWRWTAEVLTGRLCDGGEPAPCVPTNHFLTDCSNIIGHAGSNSKLQCMSLKLWAGPLSAELQGLGILQLKIRTEFQCLQSAATGDCMLWFNISICLQSKAASDTRLARDIKQAEDKAEADAAEEQRLRQEEMDSIDR